MTEGQRKLRAKSLAQGIARADILPGTLWTIGPLGDVVEAVSAPSPQGSVKVDMIPGRSFSAEWIPQDCLYPFNAHQAWKARAQLLALANEIAQHNPYTPTKK